MAMAIEIREDFYTSHLLIKLPNMEVKFNKEVPKLNFLIRFWEVYITLNQPQDDLWFVLTNNT